MIKMVSVADIISLLNAVFGFFAIILIINNETRLAFTFVLLGLLADGLDGFVSRKIKQSQIGDYLESMADMTTTGIAVSIFIYMSYQNLDSYENLFLVALLVLYLSMNVIRLASFPLLKNKEYFVGLPAPACAIILITLSYVEVDIVFIQLALVILSILLISKIRFIKPDVKIDGIAFLLIILTIILGDTYNYIAPYLLIVAMIIYILAGSIYFKLGKK